MQTLPRASPALGDVGVVGTEVMHLEFGIGTVGEQLLTTRPEVGESGYELLWGRCGVLVKPDRGHRVLLTE